MRNLLKQLESLCAAMLVCGSAAFAPVYSASRPVGSEPASPNGSIDMFCMVNGQADDSCCEADAHFDPALGFGQIQIAIAFRLSGATAGGISGAEFYIEGLEALPGNWQCSVQAPLDAVVDGDFCNPHLSQGQLVRRGSLAFSGVTGPLPEDGCRVGENGFVSLGTVTLQTFGDTVDLDLVLPRVVASAPPRPNLDCPFVWLCDAPVFTAVCVSGGSFVINNGLQAAHTPTPADGATVPNTGVQLSWESPPHAWCTAAALIESVYFGTDPDPPMVSFDVSGGTYDPGPLQPFTTYSWKIRRQVDSTVVDSPVWSFTTNAPDPVTHATRTRIKNLYR